MAQRTRGGKRQFLVRWLDYSPENDSWEDEVRVRVRVRVRLRVRVRVRVRVSLDGLDVAVAVPVLLLGRQAHPVALVWQRVPGQSQG